jgi:hypothetical protein
MVGNRRLRTLSPKSLKKQIRHVFGNYYVLWLEWLILGLRNGKALDPKGWYLMFDPGLMSNLGEMDSLVVLS